MHFELKDVITIAIAVVGAVLGIINTWQVLDQRRVRLRVVPQIARMFFRGEFGKPMGCIEVINLSAFPVRIHEIGFTIKGDPRSNKRLVISAPLTADQKPFARTLPARHSVTGYFDLNTIGPEIRKAYVMTDCREVAYGKGQALKSMRRG